ncbi:hypothetical protein B0H19DRAFT_1065362 [Mycena capillaripes]|nr:hypothetical protein B0H19DRAFT_1065362 [Mycena capillaripes]
MRRSGRDALEEATCETRGGKEPRRRLRKRAMVRLVRESRKRGRRGGRLSKRGVFASGTKASGGRKRRAVEDEIALEMAWSADEGQARRRGKERHGGSELPRMDVMLDVLFSIMASRQPLGLGGRFGDEARGATQTVALRTVAAEMRDDGCLLLRKRIE